jgi:hypothetical protein
MIHPLEFLHGQQQTCTARNASRILQGEDVIQIAEVNPNFHKEGRTPEIVNI